MMEVDAAEALLQLTGKMPKRKIIEVVEQEGNKRQKLSMLDISQNYEMQDKGLMNLKNMLNSTNDSKTTTLISPVTSTKLKNREIIKSYWEKYFLNTLPNDGLVKDDQLSIGTLDLSDDQGWMFSLHKFLKSANLKQVKQLVSDFLLQKVREKFSDITQIPWKVIMDCGLVGWPKDLPIENVWGMGFSKLHTLISKLDEIELSSALIEQLESKKVGRSNKIQSLQKNICFSIRNTISQQLGVLISNIPWKELHKEDFINWPENIPVTYPVNLTLPQKVTLNDRLHEIKLSEAALDRIKGLMSSEIHVLRKEIISALRLKLNEQTGVQIANVPWKDLKQNDIENWPESVPLEYPNLLSSNQNKLILEHLHEIKFSDDFLKKISENFASNRHYQGKTSSNIAKDLREKLNLQMKSYVSGIPWKDMSEEDIIGWPTGVPVKHPHHLTLEEREKVLKNIDDMSFSEDFLERLKSKKVCFDLRKLVSSGLRSKLATELGCVVAHIPWKEITIDDIHGWPSDVPIKYPNLLSASQNKKIMDNINNIQFTPNFLQKCKIKMA